MSTLEIVIIVILFIVAIYILYTKLSCDPIKDISNELRILIRGSGQKFTLFTQEPWFSDIKSGKKKIEVRLGGPDKFQDIKGKKIQISAGKGKKVNAIVKDVRHYEDLDTYIKKEGWKAIAPHVKSADEAKAAYLSMRTTSDKPIFTVENIAEKKGLVAIEFELMK